MGDDMKRIGRPPTYASVHERIVANTELLHADNPCSCWIWTGAKRGTRGNRPAMAVRKPGKPHPVTVDPLRMLLACKPDEEASHLCTDSYLCVHPDHAVAESKHANIQRRDGVHVALPVPERGDPDADIAWPPAGVLCAPDEECPF